MISAFAIFRATRSPETLLRLVAAANTLFFASFVAVLLFAGGQARAEDIVCAGHSMMGELTPAQQATLDAESAKIINGDGRLWKIEKAGQAPSYLFGTMHMTDPRVIDLTPEARKAFDSADTVVIETTEVLDDKVSAKALLARPDLMMFTDQTTLTSLVKPEELAKLEAGLKARGVPLITVNKMKPWMITSLIALPSCELKRKQGGAPFLDIKLAKDAQAAGKAIEGLETIVEQLDAMAALPIEFHVQSLVESVALGPKMEDIMETMIALYAAGDTGKITPFMKAISPEDPAGKAKYGDFEEVMINARNKVMASRAEPILARGKAFIAVGALHLPGEKGLVETFRRAGYTVTLVAK